jgi:hypothetical protein
VHKDATTCEQPSRQFIELYFIIVHRYERHVLTYKGHFADMRTSTGTALLFYYYTLQHPHFYIPMAIKILLQSYIYVSVVYSIHSAFLILTLFHQSLLFLVI